MNKGKAIKNTCEYCGESFRNGGSIESKSVNGSFKWSLKHCGSVDCRNKTLKKLSADALSSLI